MPQVKNTLIDSIGGKHFRDFNFNLHRIDVGGNHFINGRLANPIKYSELELSEMGEGYKRPLNIGDTYPTEDRRVAIITGHITPDPKDVARRAAAAAERKEKKDGRNSN
jgi:hypothetical protein